MTYDVAIVGNGILAYSTAYFLNKIDPQLKIAIIGPKERIGSGSIAAGAMLNTFAEVTNRTFSSSAGQAKFEMALKASTMWPDWLERLNEHLPLERKLHIQEGTFVVLNARSGKLDCENFDAIIAALEHYEEPYEHVNAKDIPGLNPFEDSRPLNSVFIPKEGAINTLEVLNALEIILSLESIVTFIDDYATKVIYEGEKVTGIQTAQNGILNAAQVMLANGVYAQNLIDQIPEIKDRIPRILAGMGCSLLLRQNSDTPINHVIRTPNRSGACGLHVLPRDQATLYVGATNNVYFEPQTTPSSGLMYFLLQCVIEQIDQTLYNSPLLGWHIGNRPATIDTFPLIGETSIRGLWLLTGTYRDGFHQAPLLGQHVAGQILGKRGLIENIFLPERPLIQTMTPSESIEEYILHYMAATYEHGSRPPKFALEKGYALPIRYKTERLYENLKTDFGLSPDMVYMFDFDSALDKRIAYFRDYFSKTTHRALSETVIKQTDSNLKNLQKTDTQKEQLYAIA